LRFYTFLSIRADVMGIMTKNTGNRNVLFEKTDKKQGEMRVIISSQCWKKPADL